MALGPTDRTHGSLTLAGTREPAKSTPAYQVIRRNGTVTPFDASKITIAVTKAFLAVEGGRAAASRRVHEAVEDLTQGIVAALNITPKPKNVIKESTRQVHTTPA